MTHHDPHALLKMAEQIARNIPDRAHVTQATSQHMKAFWSPSMIAELQNFSHKHPQEVSDEVRGALKNLASEGI